MRVRGTSGSRVMFPERNRDGTCAAHDAWEIQDKEWLGELECGCGWTSFLVYLVMQPYGHYLAIKCVVCGHREPLLEEDLFVYEEG